LDTRVVAEILTEIVKLLGDLQTSVDEVDQRTERIEGALGLPPEDEGEERHHGQENWIEED